jgi:hypothetical protein
MMGVGRFRTQKGTHDCQKKGLIIVAIGSKMLGKPRQEMTPILHFLWPGMPN